MLYNAISCKATLREQIINGQSSKMSLLNTKLLFKL